MREPPPPEDWVTAGLPPRRHPPHPALHHATGPGRIRQAVLEIQAAVRADPLSARGILRRELRRRSRSLGSKGRKLASTVLHDLVRLERVEDLLLDRAGADPDDLLARYLGHLVLVEGLEPGEAEGRHPGPDYAVFAHPDPILEDWSRGRTPAEVLALAGSLPLAVATEWVERLGAAAPLLVRASRTRPRPALRVNRSRTTAAELTRQLEQAGITLTKGTLARSALLVEGHPPLRGLPAFRKGMFELQDEGSQCIAELVAPRPGLRVVDLCAGAGGKSLALADAGAEVQALDTRAAPLRELRRRARRAGLAVQVHRISPDAPLPVQAGSADAVLVDAPCSGSGTLRRHPAQRYHLVPPHLHRHRHNQAALLERAAALLAPGGRLVYATCSLLRAENEQQVDRFLDRREGWNLAGTLGETGTLWPHVHGTDGYYGVALRRG